MSIAFNVNAGPLSQVGLEIASLPTAYQLATSAYGWFKASERSKALTESLSVSGGQLVSTSSFNFSLYRAVRLDHSSVQGVLAQHQKVQRTKLPKGSTAVPDHSGTACLRALTAGLLCLYRSDAIVEMLQDLIPYALIQLNQEDTSFEIEGALLTSLRHWVTSVAVEEDSDLFRNYMLEKLTIQQSRLTGTVFDEIMGMDHTSVNEIPLVIGVLRWILTPWHKRNFKQYPTRSLKVWTTASIMETLGFEVQAELVVVQSVSDYQRNMQPPYRFGETARVFLVTINGEETDPMPVKHVPCAEDTRRPQITMMRGIPWIAFRHLRGTSGQVDTQYLADIWKFSFKSAEACFRGISMFHQNIQIEIADSELLGVSEHHKSLISDFSPVLERICGPAMRQFIPMSPHSPGWNLSELREQMRTLRAEKELLDTRSPCKDNCYVLYAIVCGAIYGLCSKTCVDSGDALNEDSEIAFIPDVLYEGGGERLRSWARTVGHSLSGHNAALEQWNDLLFEMFLGKDTESGSLTASSKKSYIGQQNPYRQRLLLGAQANGVTAVSEILVNTTVRAESSCCFHISRGQILNFPLTEDSYIQASSYIEPASALNLDPEPTNTILRGFDTDRTESAMRIDVEPSWGEDPRTILFMARCQGVPVTTLNISAFLDRISYQAVPCVCPEALWEVPVPVTEQWRRISSCQLKQMMKKGMSFKRADVSCADTKILIDASESAAATIYAICILHVKLFFVAKNCLFCAHKQALLNSQNTSVTVLIPYQGDSQHRQGREVGGRRGTDRR